MAIFANLSMGLLFGGSGGSELAKEMKAMKDKMTEQDKLVQRRDLELFSPRRDNSKGNRIDLFNTNRI